MFLNEAYVTLKNNVIKAERRILKELGFCVHVKHPHKVWISVFLFRKVVTKTTPLFTVHYYSCWNFGQLQECWTDPSCLVSFSCAFPHHIFFWNDRSFMFTVNCAKRTMFLNETSLCVCVFTMSLERSLRQRDHDLGKHHLLSLIRMPFSLSGMCSIFFLDD